MSYSDQFFDDSSEEGREDDREGQGVGSGFSAMFSGAKRSVSWLLGSDVDLTAQADELERSSRGRLRDAMLLRAVEYSCTSELVLLVLTWNVASEAPPPDLEGLLRRVIEPLPAMPDVVVIGLQEVEFGGTALMLETTDASVAWMEAIVDSLHSIGRADRVRFKKVAMTQLVGLTLVLLSRVEHVSHVRAVRLSMSRTGAMAMVGNKGAIGLRATIHHKRFLFITAHFAAHKGKLDRRNSDFKDAIAQLQLESPDWLDDDLEYILDSPIRPQERCKGQGILDRLFQRKEHGAKANSEAWQLLLSHDYCFLFGDLNYRLSAHSFSKDDVLLRIQRGQLSELLAFDELLTQLRSDGGLYGFDEAPIAFPPTYKFDKGTSRYDSVKKREPAWTDRVLFRVGDAGIGTRNELEVLSYASADGPTPSDHRPVVAAFRLACRQIDKVKALQVVSEVDPTALPRGTHTSGELSE